jgi:hypothetical protein
VHVKRAGCVVRALALCVAGLALSATNARADATSDRCVDANTNGQALRLDGKLAEARAQLEGCIDPQCPSIVQSDCMTRLADLDAAQPTMVLELEAPPGGPVTVSIDGKPVTLTPGTPLRVDPGTHLFMFTRDGQEAVSRTFVVREREKDRHEKIVLSVTVTGAGAVAPSDSPRRTVGVVVGAAGVATLAVGAVFGLLTSAASRRQQNDCASAANCSDRAEAVSDHSAAQTDGAISTVAFVVGGALLLGGGLLFFTAPRDTPSRVSLAPTVGPRGATMSLRLAF